jgi:cyclase
VPKLADGVFCGIEWEGANVGAISTDEGCVLVDSPMLPRDAREWKEQIAAALHKPALYLINTDYHFDHIMTDCLLCERVIAHSLAEPSFLTQSGEVFEQLVGAFFPDIDEKSRSEIRGLRSVAPHITFADSLALNAGSRRIELTHVGGHTPATSIVYLPDEGILFTGDVHVHDRHPFPGDGDLLQWIDALTRIEKMDAERIVPGHGEVCGLDSVARLREYFEETEGRIRDLMAQGCDREEVEKRVDLLSFFPVDEGREARTESFVKLGIGRMYDQLAEAAAG